MTKWKDIPGYEGYYQASDLGEIKSVDRYVKSRNGNRLSRGIILTPEINNGYKLVVLSKLNIKKHYYVHRLVAIAFVLNPDNKPEVNHEDGDKLNNKSNNLKWCTDQENTKHAYENNLAKGLLGSNNSQSKLTNNQVKYIFENKNTIASRELSKSFNVSEYTIQSIFRGDSWNHITGLKRRKRNEKRQIIEGKNQYTYYTRKSISPNLDK